VPVLTERYRLVPLITDQICRAANLGSPIIGANLFSPPPLPLAFWDPPKDRTPRTRTGPDRTGPDHPTRAQRVPDPGPGWAQSGPGPPGPSSPHPHGRGFARCTPAFVPALDCDPAPQHTPPRLRSLHVSTRTLACPEPAGSPSGGRPGAARLRSLTRTGPRLRLLHRPSQPRDLHPLSPRARAALKHFLPPSTLREQEGCRGIRPGADLSWCGPSQDAVHGFDFRGRLTRRPNKDLRVSPGSTTHTPACS